MTILFYFLLAVTVFILYMIGMCSLTFHLLWVADWPGHAIIGAIALAFTMASFVLVVLFLT